MTTLTSYSDMLLIFHSLSGKTVAFKNDNVINKALKPLLQTMASYLSRFELCVLPLKLLF